MIEMEMELEMGGGPGGSLLRGCDEAGVLVAKL